LAEYHVDSAGLIHRDAGDWHAGSCGGPDGARQVTLAECGWASRHGDNPLNHKLWRKSGRLGSSGGIDQRIA
jgi:hypothetical protein